jgi:hypothetical protein
MNILRGKLSSSSSLPLFSIPESEERRESPLVSLSLSSNSGSSLDLSLSSNSRSSSNSILLDERELEDDDDGCPKVIDFYTKEYQKKSPVILLITTRNIDAIDANDAQRVPRVQDARRVQYDDKIVEYDPIAEDVSGRAKDIKKKKPKSESYDYNDTPTEKEKKKEKYDKLTPYKNVILIIFYINLKFELILILYKKLLGFYTIFKRTINFEPFKENMTMLINVDNNSDNKKSFYYNRTFIENLKSNIDNKKIIKDELNKHEINTISIKREIKFQTAEINKFLFWIYHMAESENSENLEESQKIKNVSTEFENNTKKYYNFNDRIIKKFSKEEKKNSPNKSKCLKFWSIRKD